MDLRPFLRPIPLLIILAFAAVAIVDLVQTLREEPPPPPVLLRKGAVRFEPLEPVIDFRSGRIDPNVKLMPDPVLVGALWSEPAAGGTWMLGDGAELELTLYAGGHSRIEIECRPAGGKRPVRNVEVSMNGIGCGAANLREGWQWVSLELPEGAMRSGANLVVFHLSDRTESLRSRRALQLRRIGLGRGQGFDPEAPLPTPPTLDFESQTAAILSAGTLETDFLLDDRVDALRMSYRFSGRGGDGEIIVSRPAGGGIGRDAPIRRVLSPSDDGKGRVRIPLHGRRGDFVFRLKAGSLTGRDRLDIGMLELVTERNRRKRKASRDP